jgi:hypothetical protein
VAGHPLRPATRHRLGEPLPRQLADRPRAPPSAPEVSHPEYAPQVAYAVLPGRWAGYPPQTGRSLTCYAPVRRCPAETGPLDLHVLSTPPAFVLSQDQTLQENLLCSTRTRFLVIDADLRVRNHSCVVPLPAAHESCGSLRAIARFLTRLSINHTVFGHRSSRRPPGAAGEQ